MTQEHVYEVVEYKHDAIAHRTGNIFVETVLVVEANKLGWANTVKAHYFTQESLGDASGTEPGRDIT